MSRHELPASNAHESSDAPAFEILKYGALLGVLCAVAALLMWGMFALLDAHMRSNDAIPHPMAQREEPPPGPRLQASPGRDLVEFQAAQRRALSSYVWIDKDAGIVRIPVDRALELVEKSGLPHRPMPAPERKQ